MKKLTLEEAKAKFPVDTPVWYFPVNNDVATKTATWVRCTPFCVGALGDVVVQVANQINTVSVDHLELRQIGDRHIPDSLKAPNINEVCEKHGVDPAVMQQLADLESSKNEKPIGGLVEFSGVDLGSSDYSAIQIGSIIDEMEEAARDCPTSMGVSDRDANDRYTRHLKATTPKNLLPVLEYLRSLMSAAVVPSPVIYQYSASINTARGSVAYDGIVERPRFIRSIEDYQAIREQIAADASVVPGAVNVLNLSIAGGALYEELAK